MLYALCWGRCRRGGRRVLSITYWPLARGGWVTIGFGRSGGVFACVEDLHVIATSSLRIGGKNASTAEQGQRHLHSERLPMPGACGHASTCSHHPQIYHTGLVNTRG
jgi:hypothetical protein